jgi:hypothetical protein
MVKRQSEYSAAELAGLFPGQRYAATQAESDSRMGRAAIPVRAADGRSTIYVDPVTKQPIATPTPLRSMGGSR